MTRKEAILKIENRWGIMGYCESDALGEALDMAIEALKTDVVYCKDCKYYDESLEVCRCSQWDLSRIEYPMVDADGFCSYGERRYK